MKSVVASILLGTILLTNAVRADDKDDPVSKQRMTAKANWDKLEAGPMVSHETAHLIVLAPKAMEKRLKDVGNLLEKSYETAAKVLFMPREEVWAGKLTVYLLARPEQLDSFLRVIEKRRVRGVVKGTFAPQDDRLHAAASPPREKGDPSVEAQAAQQIASAVLARKAGVRTPLPSWLVEGFGRATWYRAASAASPAVASERRAATRFAFRNQRSVRDVWGAGLSGDEAEVLQASLAELLAYGSLKAKFGEVLEGLKPGGNGQERTTEQALSSASLTVDGLNRSWLTWLRSRR